MGLAGLKGAHFLWPRPERLRSAHFGSRATPSDVERVWDESFPCSRSVAFSSARAALNAALGVMGLGRGDCVHAPLYSSHCVLESIARVATPTPDAIGAYAVSAQLLVHQWGFVHTSNCTPARGIIEDSVDTLFVPGTPLFASGGRFVLISFPKIVGSFGGGLICCNSDADLEAMRERRALREHTVEAQFRARLAAADDAWQLETWSGRESSAGAPAAPVCADIVERLRRYDQFVTRVRSNIETAASIAQLVPARASHRMPSNIVVSANAAIALVAERLGFTSGVRHFRINLDARSNVADAVLPIPVHYQVPAPLLEQLCATGAT
jgi:putative PLP-dependent aminotransferase (TIGR04422 family)